ncbi:hypothetical protein QUA79_17560 [Microcoleus sp. F8-D1]
MSDRQSRCRLNLHAFIESIAHHVLIQPPVATSHTLMVRIID